MANELNAPVFAPTRPVGWNVKANKWIFDTEDPRFLLEDLENIHIKPEWLIFYPTKK